jgi:hypothetical protein
MVERADPDRYRKFVAESEDAARRRYIVYKQLAGISVPPAEAAAAPPPAEPAAKEQA